MPIPKILKNPVSAPFAPILPYVDEKSDMRKALDYAQSQPPATITASNKTKIGKGISKASNAWQTKVPEAWKFLPGVGDVDDFVYLTEAIKSKKAGKIALAGSMLMLPFIGGKTIRSVKKLIKKKPHTVSNNLFTSAEALDYDTATDLASQVDELSTLAYHSERGQLQRETGEILENIGASSPNVNPLVPSTPPVSSGTENFVPSLQSVRSSPVRNYTQTDNSLSEIARQAEQSEGYKQSLENSTRYLRDAAEREARELGRGLTDLENAHLQEIATNRAEYELSLEIRRSLDNLPEEEAAEILNNATSMPSSLNYYVRSRRRNTLFGDDAPKIKSTFDEIFSDSKLEGRLDIPGLEDFAIHKEGTHIEIRGVETKEAPETLLGKIPKWFEHRGTGRPKLEFSVNKLPNGGVRLSGFGAFRYGGAPGSLNKAFTAMFDTLPPKSEINFAMSESLSEDSFPTVLAYLKQQAIKNPGRFKITYLESGGLRTLNSFGQYSKFGEELKKVDNQGKLDLVNKHIRGMNEAMGEFAENVPSELSKFTEHDKRLRVALPNVTKLQKAYGGYLMPYQSGGYIDQQFSNPVIGGYDVNEGLVDFSNGGGLPQYGFGSWLGDNAGKILKTAGSVAMAIPAIGPVVGGIMIGAGTATDAIVGKVRDNRAEDALAITQDQDATNAAYESRIGNQPMYAPTAEYGGNLMGQSSNNRNPAIVGYDGNSNTHQQGVGGVPVDSRGNPSVVSKQSAVALTEKGEVTWNGYVFSDKLTV